MLQPPSINYPINMLAAERQRILGSVVDFSDNNTITNLESVAEGALITSTRISQHVSDRDADNARYVLLTDAMAHPTTPLSHDITGCISTFLGYASPTETNHRYIGR